MKFRTLILAALAVTACAQQTKDAPASPVRATPAPERVAMPEGYTGTWTTYYPDGQIESVCEMVNGEVCGTVTDYFRNGKVRDIYTERNGKREGPMNVYYEDGTLHIVYHYMDGQTTGIINSFYPNGSPLGEVARSKTKGKGVIIRFYYDNGNVSESYMMVDGKPHGDYVCYYEDGSLRRKGQYDMGKIYGTWTMWDREGNVSTVTY